MSIEPSKYNAFIRKFVKMEKKRLDKYPPSLFLQYQLIGHMYVPLIKAAIELKIIDLLAKNKSMSLDELQKETNTNREALYRLLRTLNAMQIVEIDTMSRVYKLGKTGKLLINDDKNEGLYNLAITIIYDWYDVSKNIPHYVKTGEVLRADDEKSYWDHLSKNKLLSNYFHNSMEELTHAITPAVIADYNFGKYKTIVDIGGGKGHLLYSILEKYKNTNGILFDNIDVINEAKKTTRLAKDVNLPKEIFLTIFQQAAIYTL
jgi:predicted transcriptional regulator